MHLGRPAAHIFGYAVLEQLKKSGDRNQFCFQPLSEYPRTLIAVGTCYRAAS